MRVETTPKQKALLEKAEHYFNEGETQKAYPFLRTLLEQRVESPNLYHMLASFYYDQGKFSACVSCFTKALELDPNFTDSAVGLSVVLNDLGKYEEAKKVFLRAQKKLNNKKTLVSGQIKEQIEDKHFELAQLYTENGNFAAALENLRFCSVNRAVLDLKIYIYQKKERYDLAVEEIKSYPKEKDSDLLFKLAENLYFNKQVLASMSLLEKILDLDVSHVEAKNFYNKIKSTTFDLRTSQEAVL